MTGDFLAKARAETPFASRAMYDELTQFYLQAALAHDINDVRQLKDSRSLMPGNTDASNAVEAMRNAAAVMEERGEVVDFATLVSLYLPVDFPGDDPEESIPVLKPGTYFYK